MDYETGVLAALLVWLYSAVSLPVRLHSRVERNLNRAGLRRSWITFQPKPATRQDLERPWYRALGKYLLIIGLGLPVVLASWLSVAWFVGSLLYHWAKDFGAPPAVKEFRWRLRNTDMTFDDIVKGMMDVSRQDAAEFDRFKAEWRSEMRERGLA